MSNVIQVKCHICKACEHKHWCPRRQRRNANTGDVLKPTKPAVVLVHPTARAKAKELLEEHNASLPEGYQLALLPAWRTR